MSTDVTATKHLWCPPTWVRAVSVVVGLVGVFLAIWSIHVASVEGGSMQGMVTFAIVVFFLPSLALVVFAFRVRMSVLDDGLDLTTMFQKRRFTWDQIRGVEPDRSGVKLALADGSMFQTGALYGPSWSSLFGRSDTADALAAVIAERADLDNPEATPSPE